MPKWTTTGEPADAKLPLLSNGACAEISAADKLIRQGVKPTDIRISQAYRPRDAHRFDISEVPPEAPVVSTCKNCIKVFVE